ncbi:MAG: hypothetical protein CVU02_02065 [Bacteroidetes bacterium HGW-Bacteroidetes-19]|nr:MAG: hypothetical protein CVU02_02065 [Bacteroidetes bacterium HGW-Bacteroidetes-19]
MKRKLQQYLLGSSMMILILGGCTKFDELFNFNNLDGLEGTSSWGIPIVNAKYSIGDLVQQFDSSGIMQVAPDGTISLVYSFEQEQIIKASDFLKVDNQVFSTPYVINPNRLSNSTSIEQHIFPLSFDNELMKIMSASIKTGTIVINVTNDMEQQYYCKLTTPNIKTSTGENLSITFSPTLLNYTINLANYTILPGDNNTGEFNVEVGVINNGITPTADHYDLNISMTLNNFSLKSVYAKIAPYEIPFNESFDFDLSSEQYGADITVYNPKLFISTKNSFLINGRIQLDTAAFSGDNEYSSIITNPPTNINIPISPINYQTDQIDAFSNININTEYNKIQLSGVAILNPNGFNAGVVRIDENSEISLKIKAEIPLDLKITNTFYADTIPFDLNDLLKDIPMADLKFIDTLAFRTVFESTLPINVYTQVLFLDTNTNTIIDSLFTNSKILYGSFNNSPVPSPPQMIQISGDRIENIKSCEKILFRIKLDTENRKVIFNTNQYLKASLGLKAVFNYNQLSIN